jgi:hydroxymethylbilane synthase
MTQAHIKIGTRGSKLALIQAKLVEQALLKRDPSLQISTNIIQTKGDVNQSPIPLDTVGKSWFTAEIETALSTGKIDIAVHSLKDLPLEDPKTLATLVIMKRADPRDVLVSRSGDTLERLPFGSVVGTDSTRRAALIHHLRPDLTVKSLRGNVDTRLTKLANGYCDAIIVAAAGLDRLGRIGEITEYLDPATFIPSVGQGALAVQIRSSDDKMRSLIEKSQHQPTVIATLAERAFSEAIGGGCKLPVGCYVQIAQNAANIYGMIAELDGPGIMFDSISSTEPEAMSAARDLASRMAASCPFTFTLGNI